MVSTLEKIELGTEAALALAGGLIAVADVVSYMIGEKHTIKLEDLPALIESEEVKLAAAELRRRKASAPYLDEPSEEPG